MEAVLDRLNIHARVVLCGLISQYGSNARAAGPENLVNLLMRRVSVYGFNIMDYVPRFPAAILRMGLLLRLGIIKDERTIVRGLDNAPEALVGLFRGDHCGKVLVEV